MPCKPPPVVKCYYNGKVIGMEYVPDPKDRFKIACYRIRDNGAEGYVVEGEKVYRISNASRMAILVKDEEERVKVLAEIESIK